MPSQFVASFKSALLLLPILISVGCGIGSENQSSSLSETSDPAMTSLQRQRISEDLRNASVALTGAMMLQDVRGYSIITREILASTQCLISMRLTRAAFLLGGEGGVGVMTCRVGSGWSAPSFVRAGGFDLSAAIGFQTIDMVSFITSPAVAERYKGQANFEASPILAAVAANADIALNQVQRYGMVTVQSDSSGLYAGVGISFTSLSHMQAARNQIVYGRLFNGGEAYGEPVDPSGRLCSSYVLPSRRQACTDDYYRRVGGGASRLVSADMILNLSAEYAPEITRGFNETMRRWLN